MMNNAGEWIDRAKLDFMNSTHMGVAVLLWVNADGHPTFVTSMVSTDGQLDRAGLTELLLLVLGDIARSEYDTEDSKNVSN